jgi:hypothetical protein
MSRRTINVKVEPANSEKFLELCEAIIAHHTLLGAASPFADGTIVNMTNYTDRATRARQKREEALELYAAAEAAMYESRQLIGVAPGQTVLTEGTLYNQTINAKKILLVLNRTNPEALSPWGFDVVVRIAKKTGPKKKG